MGSVVCWVARSHSRCRWSDLGWATQDYGRRHWVADLTEIARRREYTRQRWEALALLASEHFDEVDLASRTCIYVTGSMARDEATEGSDLDLFVVDELRAEDRPLNYVETSQLVARLDNVRRDGQFRPFSRGGEFIRTLSMQDLVKLIGDPQDDALNLFTARMLLLINSRPLTNPDAYERAWKTVLDRYWAPQDPEADFRPVMLLNDIRRWWGVLCLNFERFNPFTVVDEYTARTSTERRVANLKLRFARVMAAYTPIVGLLDISRPDGLISRQECEDVLRRSPVRRLEELTGTAGNVSEAAAIVLEAYDQYLAFMNKSKSDLFRAVRRDDSWASEKSKAYDFHEKFVSLYRAVGQDKTLFEYSIV